MIFSFKARIYKVGINPCVKVPKRITRTMVPVKGYVPVKGTINNHSFIQTLCPVNGEPHRLYINGIMLKSSKTRLGDVITVFMEQDFKPRTIPLRLYSAFGKKLKEHNLLATFRKLIPSQQKEILRYINHLKSVEARNRIIERVLHHLATNPDGYWMRKKA